MPSNPKSLLRRVLPTAHRIIVEKKIQEKLISIQGRVLVIGAGHDPYSDLLTNAESILVTDISDEFGVVDKIADAHDLPFEDSSFDVILAIEVVEHLKSPLTAVKEFYRVLAEGGHVICSIPFLFHVHGDPYDFQRFTRHGLLRLFNGYQLVEIDEMGGRLATISDIITTQSKFIIPFRVFNNIFHLPFLRTLKSSDSPSGYWVEAKK